MQESMPDFVASLEDERSGRRARRRALRERLQHAAADGRPRRIVAAALVGLVVGVGGVLGLSALTVDRSADAAVALVERYADAVAEGDVERMIAMLPPDAALASTALLTDEVVARSEPVLVDGVHLVSGGPVDAVVRVDYRVGGEDRATDVTLRRDDDGSRDDWHLTSGLLGRVEVDEPLAIALGLDAPPATGAAWLPAGRYAFAERVGPVVALRVEPVTVVAGDGAGQADAAADAAQADAPADAAPADVTVLEGPSDALVDQVLDFTRALLAACTAEPGPECPEGLVTMQGASVEWDIDVEARVATAAVLVSGIATGGSGYSTTSFAFQVPVVLSDDLASAEVGVGG